jgi:hypothetical protein
MITALVAFALLAGGGDAPAAVKTTKVSWDPDRVICKYDLQPGSRLARRKVCLTASQWEEWQRIERLNLLRSQYNGAQ